MTTSIKIRGIELVYEDYGFGEVIVFIHGQPFNRSMWTYQIETFSKTNRLIIPDLRGYGESGITERTVLLDELALDLIHLLEALDIKKASFVGLSMGGQIVFELYRLIPDMFKAMILSDTDARAESEEGYVNRINLSQRILQDGMDKFTEERINQFICKSTLDTKPLIVTHLKNMMTSTNSVGSSAVQRGRAERRDHTSILSNISIPALIIVGEEDEFTPPSVAQYMHSRIPQSKLVIIKDAGHIPNMEQPNVFNLAMRNFLESEVASRSVFI